jgi:hypothetical protein
MSIPVPLLDEQRRIVAYLDGLPPSLRFGDLQQAKVNALQPKGVPRNLRGGSFRPLRFAKELHPLFWLHSFCFYCRRLRRLQEHPIIRYIRFGAYSAVEATGSSISGLELRERHLDPPPARFRLFR